MTDTIFALSSGQPPAGIAVVRVSGRGAGPALLALAGKLPEPRHASYVRFRDPGTGAALDDGLVLWFPGPGTATGEDLAELHLHGGRAVVAAVLDCLSRQPGLRPAEAGEFTRRAFENGRIDLAQAEGLAELLAAETESQRASAIAMAEGGLGQCVARWQGAILRAGAEVEANLDFSDEGDVVDRRTGPDLQPLADEMAAMLGAPPAERLRDGVRVVLVGPPNSGKSSLFNEMIGRQAAIVTDIAGTTRDRIEAPVAIDGVPLLIIDTAGLREDAADPVEAIGMTRTGEAMADADIVLWLGAPENCPDGAILIAPKADLGDAGPGQPVSAVTGEGMDALRNILLTRARALLPKPGALALNARHRAVLADVYGELVAANNAADPLISAEHLRCARNRLDSLTGKSGVEDMLDALFGGFCIGK